MSIASARGGAALILALVVLAALLLLGLPFLFSQSAGMTGTRSYAHHVAATTARDGAEAIAVAAAAYAMEPHWSFGYAPSADQTDLVQTLTADQPIAAEDALAAGRAGNRIAIDFKIPVIGLNASTINRPTVGAAISDESGKLDVNALSPRGWDLLLKAAGIPDWDDSAHANTRNGSFDSVNNKWNSGNDADDIGELATALAQLRFTSAIPEHRITQLEQLLLADPGYNTDQIPPGQPSTNQSGKSYGFRTPLSRTELERLRPYLTVHNLGQARGGVLDLGTVGFLDDDVVNAGRTNQPVIDSQPQAWDANDLSQRSAVVQGTMLLTGVEDSSGPAGLHRGGVATGANLYTWDDRLKPTIAVNAAIGIAVPAEVNINAASTVVRGVYGNTSAPSAGLTSLPALATLPAVKATQSSNINLLPYAYQAPGIPVTSQQPFELPALGIASFGLVTIDSAAVFADAAQHQAAQRGRRVVAQAVPQEDLLERRWTRQTAFEHDLLARRFSRMASWPFPSARLLDQMPEDVDTDPQVGLAPAPLPSLDDGDAAPHLINSPQRLDWKRAFTGAIGTFSQHQLLPLADAGNPVNGPLSATSLTPEGVRLTNADHLAYDFSTGGNTPFLTPVVSGPNATEILPRQISVWVRSKSDWDTGVVPILEVRMPPANAGLPLDGVSAGAQMDSRAGAGDTSLQNHWSLTYDGKNKHLVLALANPGIEHPADYGPKIPFDDPSSSLDESSLGSGTAYPSAPLAPKRPFNRVEHRYYMPLEKDRWYLIQACFSTDRPGGQSIIVDGLVGTDVALSAMHAGGSGPIELTKPGDHITVPCALLAADLPAETDATTRKPIALRPVLTGSLFPNGLADMLPAHGFVRIDDEYISYESISGTSLANCRRGRRQNTDLSDANPASHVPVMPAHTAGSLVVPGGYRLTAIGDVLLSGGRALAAPVPNGVICGVGAHTGQVLVWSQIDTSSLPAAASPPNPPNTAKIANAAAMTIPLKASAGDPADFPPHGFVIIEGAFGGPKYAYYDGVSGNSLTGVQGWYTMPPAGVVPDPPTDNADLLMSTIGPPPTVLLMSVEVDGDPTSPTAYAQAGDRLIQLYDALGDGHIEWLRYTNTILKSATSGTHGFFLNSSGFYYAAGSPSPPGISTRGVERTNFPGPTGAVSGPQWALGARVIPVQTGSVAGIIAETGDILTLAPRAPSGVPYQVAVRFRPTDDFSAGGLDTHNHYFALTEALPVPVDLGKVDVLNWPAWNGKDLSPFGPVWPGSQISGVYGCMPWTTSSTTAFTTPDDRRVYLASFDERCTAAGASPVSQPFKGAVDGGVPQGADTAVGSFNGLIDRPTAGEEPGTANDVVTAISTGTIAAGAAPPFDVQATTGIFAFQYGLVEIGGEVFAYQKSNNAQIATMIARGLLGSAKTDHAVGDPILHLPLGPIGILAKDLAVGDRRKLVFSNGPQILQAPAILLCDSNPTAASTCEVIVAPRMLSSDQWGATMPWLRGMYDTPPRSWSAATTIAIGWYPRYASALPHDWNGLYQPYYRCRSYAWASFPLRFYGIDPAKSEAEVNLLDNGSLTNEGSMFDCRVAASGGAFQDFPDWGSWKTLGSATAAVQAVPIDCDGVELRVCWKYAKAASGALTDIAASGNRAPMLGTVRLRVHAPADTVAVEETR